MKFGIRLMWLARCRQEPLRQKSLVSASLSKHLNPSVSPRMFRPNGWLCNSGLDERLSSNGRQILAQERWYHASPNDDHHRWRLKSHRRRRHFHWQRLPRGHERRQTKWVHHQRRHVVHDGNVCDVHRQGLWYLPRGVVRKHALC